MLRMFTKPFAALVAAAVLVASFGAADLAIAKTKKSAGDSMTTDTSSPDAPKAPKAKKGKKGKKKSKPAM